MLESAPRGAPASHDALEGVAHGATTASMDVSLEDVALAHCDEFTTVPVPVPKNKRARPSGSSGHSDDSGVLVIREDDDVEVEDDVDLEVNDAPESVPLPASKIPKRRRFVPTSEAVLAAAASELMGISSGSVPPPQPPPRGAASPPSSPAVPVPARSTGLLLSPAPDIGMALPGRFQPNTTTAPAPAPVQKQQQALPKKTTAPPPNTKPKPKPNEKKHDKEKLERPSTFHANAPSASAKPKQAAAGVVATAKVNNQKPKANNADKQPDKPAAKKQKTNKPPTAPPAAPPPAAAAAASQKPEVEKEEAQKQSTQQTWQTSTPPTRRAAARATQAFNTYASQEDDRCKFVAANGRKCHKESEFGERYCEKHIRMAEKMESQSQSQKQQPPPLPLARAKRNILGSDTPNNTAEERKALAQKINENAKLFANLFHPAMAPPKTNLSDETSCCHWCQGRSPVFAVCPNQGKEVKKTGNATTTTSAKSKFNPRVCKHALPCPRVCPKCIYLHHSSLIDAWNIKTPEELKKRWIEFMKGGCPQCRAVCSCRICLRGVPGKQLDRDTGATALYYVNADGVIGELPPIPQGEKQDFAKHVAHALAATCVPRIARSAHEAAMVHQKLHALDQVAERTINALGDGERAICSNPECGTSLWNDYYSAPATEKEIEAWQKQKEEEKAAKGGGKAAMAAAAPAAKGLDDDDDDDDDEEEEEEEEEGQGPPDTELCPDCFIRRVQAMQETMDADQEEVDFVKSLKRCGLEPASRFDAALQLPLPKHTEPATLPRLPLAKKVLQRGERIADMPSICTPVSNINPGEEGSPEVDNTSNVVLASLPADAAKLHKNIFSPTMWQMRHGIEGEPEPSNLRTADGVKYGPQFVERTDPEMFAAFHKRWMQGEPILMRRCIGRMSWAPRVLRRMARESRPGQTRQEGNSLTIIRCSDICEMTGMQVGEFFTNYLQGGVKRKNGVRELLKLKDWPPDGDMRDFAPRHTADFYEMCPVPEYTNPKGPFNVVSLFPQNLSQPDLGPKCYIAFGSPDEAPCEGKNGFEDRGDSVTKMHYDMADAVNLLVHVQSDAMVKAQEEGERDFSNLPCQHDEVGAVWDLFHRNDAAKLELWIKEKAAEGRWYHGPTKVVLTATQNETDAAVPDETATQNETDAAVPDESVLDHPIHDQLVYLRKDDLALLKQETGIVPWRIYQREGDAVFVPSRCPHQVRNLRPCVKIAVDFVSVENAQFAVDLADDYRGLKQGHTHKEDVLQARAVAMHAWAAAEALATGGAGAR